MAVFDEWIASPRIGERVHYVCFLPGVGRTVCWPGDIVTVHPPDDPQVPEPTCCDLWVLAPAGLLWKEIIFEDVKDFHPDTFHSREACQAKPPEEYR